MKIFVAALALLAVTTFTSAAFLPPVFDSIHEEQIDLKDVDQGIDVSPDTEIVRQRRLTCDFFSFESKVVTPNHAACAAKCIGKGKKGGSCKGTNCICRKDKWIG